MEFPVGNPDFNSFLKNHSVSSNYIVFQIHPNMWDENQFNEFKKIIDFLKEEKCTFILPREFYSSNLSKQIE
ncbi:MAG: hypothetical protein M5T52_01705 [Ignavibacteriaceae bacterium]|nr:hypothetical protein [Ignavibacteriaceae bacterium]